MNNRHRARRLALQGLCCLDIQGEHVLDLVDNFLDDSDEHPQTIEEARALLGRAYAAREEIDKLMARHARHWELSRLALVDRNILRLAAQEIKEGQTPVKVVISEALRLAQEFSTAESPRFVNGVLDAISKEIAAPPAAATDEPQEQ